MVQDACLRGPQHLGRCGLHLGSSLLRCRQRLGLGEAKHRSAARGPCPQALRHLPIVQGLWDKRLFDKLRS